MAVERTKKVRTRQRGKKWSYSFEGARINGKRKPIEKGGFATEQEAYEAGLEAYKEYRAAGSVFSGSDMSVSDFMDMWLEKVAKVSVKPNTLYNYKKKYPAIKEAFRKGKEVVDIEVENALFKKALGYTVTVQKAFKLKDVIYNENGKKISEKV